MSSEVFFIKSGSDHFTDSILLRLEKLFDRAGGGSIIKEGELVAVKGHVGEPGNVTFMSPVYYKTIIDRIKLCGGNPFLTDTNTLYVGHRNNAVNHTKAAAAHGFSLTTLGAPFIVADGLFGNEYVNVEIGQKNIKKAKIGAAVYWADSLVVISHAKMHLAASFGGTLKNLGMGCASRGGKQEQHSGGMPAVDADKCTSCGECVEWCNFDAMSLEEKIVIDEAKCSGCGECIAVCRYNALNTKWDGGSDDMQRKMAEYAMAALKNKKGKVIFFNLLMNITPDCDCLPSSGKSIVPDIGILASFDPVAIDKASIDLINKAGVIDANVKDKDEYDHSHANKDNIKMVWPKLNWQTQIDYAVEIGLGSKEYELVEV